LANESAGPNVAYYDRLAAVYHLFFEDLRESMEMEGRWLAEILGSRSAGRVLDASSGTGRQSIPLALRGFDVTAADPSAGMLRIARQMAATFGVTLPFVRSSFVELPRHFGAEFDAVIAMGNSLCHAGGPSEIRESMRAMAHCVRDGGICIVGIKDFQHILIQRRRFHPHRIVDGPDGRTLLFEIWDYEEPELGVTTFVVDQTASGWDTRTAVAREYMLSDAELRALAAEAGFTRVDKLGHPHECAHLLHR